MRNQTTHRILSRCLPALLATATALLSQRTEATPYATELQVSGGTVAFTLNESADSVKVIFGSTTNDLGALGKGSYSTNLGASGTVYVEASKSSGLGWQSSGGSNFNHTINGVSVSEAWTGRNVLSATNNLFTRFPTPRGVAVNRNPASPYFGRVYVANSTPGAAAGRSVGRGIYTLKSDLSDSPLGYGTNAQTGGITLWATAASANSPYQLSVGDDSYLYVADFADGSSLVARLSPDLASSQLVLDYTKGPSTILAPTNHGSTKKVIATGSLDGGNLKVYTMDEDYTGACSGLASNKNSIWRYDIDAGPLTNTTCGVVVGYPSPSWTVTGTEDFDLGTNGYIYAIQNRSIPNLEPGLYVIEQATGSNVWNSRTAYRDLTGVSTNNDIFATIHSVAISPDNKFLVINTISLNAASGPATGSDCWILPLTNGIPDIANRMVLDSGEVSQGRGVAFDVAGNLYTVSSGDSSLRVWSPGGYTITKTGSDGTFTSYVAPNTINVTVPVSQASQTGPTPGTFTLTRVGPTTNSLTIDFVLTGTATNGVYTCAPGSITPAATNSITLGVGETSTNITITPVNDSIPRPTTTVILSLLGGSSYGPGTPSSGTIFIQNTATPGVFLTNLDSQMYERTNDYARFRVTRWGDTNADLTGSSAVNIAFSGTAIIGTDYYTNFAAVDLPPGVINSNIYVYPIQNGTVTGSRTILATVTSGTGYNVLTPQTTGSVIIVDADLPAETVLWADYFTNDTSANWTYYFATTGSLANDYRINQTSMGTGTWPFDYFANLALPAAPGSSETKGLYMTVNKDDATPEAAALNFYPIGQSFSNNYALRFNMLLTKNDTLGQTEYAIFGINHSGNATNWFRNSAGGVPTGWNVDGVFFGVEADGAALGDYVPYSSPLTNNNPTALNAGTNASKFTAVFKRPPYTVQGAPANDWGSTTPTWVDVEISQVNNVITWKINQTEIMSFTNNTVYTNGNIMLGYCDAFDSTGNTGGSVIYANVRVVSIASAAPISINQILSAPGTVTIDFTAGASDTTANFILESSSTVNTGYSDAGATITSPSAGNFSTTVPKSGNSQFYRIKRL